MSLIDRELNQQHVDNCLPSAVGKESLLETWAKEAKLGTVSSVQQNQNFSSSFSVSSPTMTAAPTVADGDRPV